MNVVPWSSSLSASQPRHHISGVVLHDHLGVSKQGFGRGHIALCVCATIHSISMIVAAAATAVVVLVVVVAPQQNVGES